MTSLKTISVDTLKHILDFLPLDCIVALHETQDKTIRRTITSTIALPSVEINRTFPAGIWRFLKHHSGLRSLTILKSLHESTIAGPHDQQNGFGSSSFNLFETMVPPPLLKRLPSTLTTLSIASNFAAPPYTGEQFPTFGDLFPSLTTLELREFRIRNTMPQVNYPNLKMMTKLPPKLHTLVLGTNWAAPPLDAIPSSITSFTLTGAYPTLYYAYGEWTATTGLIQRQHSKTALPTIDALRVLLPRLPLLHSLSVLIASYQHVNTPHMMPPGMPTNMMLQRRVQTPYPLGHPAYPVPLTEEKPEEPTPIEELALLDLPRLDTLRISLRGSNPEELSVLLRSAPHITSFAFEGNGNHIDPLMLKWKMPASLVHLDLYPAIFEQSHMSVAPTSPATSFATLFQACPSSIASLNIRSALTGAGGIYPHSSSSSSLTSLPLSLQSLVASGYEVPMMQEWPPHLTHLKMLAASTVPSLSNVASPPWSLKLSYFYCENFTLQDNAIELLPTSLTRLHCNLNFGFSQTHIKQIVARLTNLRYFSTQSVVAYVVDVGSLSPDNSLLQSDTFKLSSFWQAEMGSIQHLISVPWSLVKASYMHPGNLHPSLMDVDFEEIAASTALGQMYPSSSSQGFSTNFINPYLPTALPTTLSLGPQPSSASARSFPPSSPPPPPFPLTDAESDEDSTSLQTLPPPTSLPSSLPSTEPSSPADSPGPQHARRRRRVRPDSSSQPSALELPTQAVRTQTPPMPRLEAQSSRNAPQPSQRPQMIHPNQMPQMMQPSFINSYLTQPALPMAQYRGPPHMWGSNRLAALPEYMSSPNLLGPYLSSLPSTFTRLQFDSDRFPPSNPMSTVTGEVALSFYQLMGNKTAELSIISKETSYSLMGDHAGIMISLRNSTALHTLILDSISSESFSLELLPPSLTTLVFGSPLMRRETGSALYASTLKKLPRGLTRLEMECTPIHPPSSDADDTLWPLGLTRLRFKPQGWHFHDAHQLVQSLPSITHLHLCGPVYLGTIKREPPMPEQIVVPHPHPRPSSPPSFPTGFFASQIPPPVTGDPFATLAPSPGDITFSKPIITPIFDLAMIKRDVMRMLAPLTCDNVCVVGELEAAVSKTHLETLIWTAEEKVPSVFTAHVIPPPARSVFFEPPATIDNQTDRRAIAEAMTRKPFEITNPIPIFRPPFGNSTSYAVSRFPIKSSEMYSSLVHSGNTSVELALMQLSGFTSLTDLEVSKECLDLNAIRMLPKSLLHLKVVISDEEMLDPFSDFPPNIQTLLIDSENPILLTSLGVKLIPQSLTKLHCNRLRLRPNLAPLLPLHLKDLSFDANGWWEETHFLELGQRFIAAGVNDFALSCWRGLASGALLPRDFTGALTICTIQSMTRKIMGPNYQLALEGLTQGELKLPPGTSSLDLHMLNLPKIPHPLPPGLTSLVVRVCEKLDCDRIEALPTSLRSLEIQFTTACTFDGYIWSSLPRDLEHLKLVYFAQSAGYTGVGYSYANQEDSPLLIAAPQYPSFFTSTNPSPLQMMTASDLGPVPTIASMAGLPCDRLQTLEMPQFRMDARCMNAFGPELKLLSVCHLEEAARLNLGRAENGYSVIELKQAITTDRYQPLPARTTASAPFQASSYNAVAHRPKPDVAKLRRDFYANN